DDAHQLSRESLSFVLSHLGPLVARRALSLLLIADASVVAECRRWAAEHDEADRFHQVELAPLTEEESGEYLQQRFTAAGWSGSTSLPASQLKSAVRQAQGNPASLARVVPALLLRRQPASGHRKRLISAYWRWSA